MVDHRAETDAVRAARRVLAAAQAQLAEAALTYADARRCQDSADRGFGIDSAGRVRARPGGFAGDELAVLLRGDPWAVRRLVARSRRVRSGLPTVWAAHLIGEIDSEQVREVDRAARRAVEPSTVHAIDASAVAAARTRTPKQLASWLLRLVVECEPLAFAERHRRALAERRVTVSQGPDGVGYVTGELLGTHQEAIGVDDEPLTRPGRTSAGGPPPPPNAPRTCRSPQTVRIGVVVPLSSLLGTTDSCGQLADRSAAVPADVLRRRISEAVDSDDEVLFTRLLTDDGGRLLDTTELGRHPSRRLAEAVALRAGTCRHPTCTVPADRCDLDHHEPHPRGPTSGRNLDPACRRHHRGKTFAWLATVRDRDAVNWTMPDATTYRCLDDPLPTGTR